ncbi:MAG: hypothetical protein IPK60_08065 [Sandaracinaceae bacterium]|nr:hypothetical protein [Sandaracinaceae bacterium]
MRSVRFRTAFAVALLFACVLCLPLSAAVADGRGQAPAHQASREMYNRGVRASVRLSAMLGVARRNHDTRREQCFDVALAQVNSHLRTMELRMHRMERAHQLGDRRSFQREAGAFRRVSEALLDAESAVSLCVSGGTSVVSDGITRVEMSVDPSAPRGELAEAGPRAMPPSAN